MIVVAAIALILLVIIVLIFSGRINLFRGGVEEIEKKDMCIQIKDITRYTCVTSQECSNKRGREISGDFRDCAGSNQICCDLGSR